MNAKFHAEKLAEFRATRLSGDSEDRRLNHRIFNSRCFVPDEALEGQGVLHTYTFAGDPTVIHEVDGRFWWLWMNPHPLSAPTLAEAEQAKFDFLIAELLTENAA